MLIRNLGWENRFLRCLVNSDGVRELSSGHYSNVQDSLTSLTKKLPVAFLLSPAFPKLLRVFRASVIDFRIELKVVSGEEKKKKKVNIRLEN